MLVEALLLRKVISPFTAEGNIMPLENLDGTLEDALRPDSMEDARLSLPVSTPFTVEDNIMPGERVGGTLGPAAFWKAALATRERLPHLQPLAPMLTIVDIPAVFRIAVEHVLDRGPRALHDEEFVLQTLVELEDLVTPAELDHLVPDGASLLWAQNLIIALCPR